MLQYRYATHLEKVLIILGVVLSAFTGVAGTLIAVTCGTVMNVIIKYVSAEKDSEENNEEAAEELIDGINTFAFLICGLGIASFICTYVSTVIFNFTTLKQLHRIRLLYLENILNQDIPWYDVHQTGDFASRMSTDIKKIEEGIGEKIALFVFFQSQFMSSVIVAIFKGWELSLVCLVGLPVNIGSMTFITWVSSKLTKQEMDAYGDAGAVAEETFSTIRTVIAFGGQQKEKERYDKLLRVAKNNNIKRSLLMALSNGLMWLLTYSGFALAFWYGTKLMIKDRQLPEEDVIYDAGNIMTIFCCVLTATYSFGMAAPYLEIISTARGAAEKVFSIIETVPTINTSKGHGKKPNQIQGNIIFKDVHFSYPSRSDTKVLQGINCTIKAGETVALVGSSGCGKSTCIQLMQRFYDPVSGHIFVDGNDLKELDLCWLREQIGVVGQEPVLFEATIAENIKLGCRSATQESIENAAKKANIHAFIKMLPQGYRTRVGERGAQLSGGQKQRIAIARALIRQPTILLLDEATSALDSSSESVVQAALDAASNECTTIIVAHRLSTVRKANRIIVMSDGGVEEEGTHDELMAAKGSYYQLVSAQVLPDEAEPLYGYSEDAPDIVQESHLPKLSVAKSPSFSDNKNGEKPKCEKPNSSLLWSLLKTNRPEVCQIIVGCLASIIAGTSIPTYSVIYGEIVGIFVEDDVEYIQSEVNKYAVYFIILAVTIAIATVFQMHMFGISGEKLSMRLRSQMFEKMLNQEMGWFDDKDNGVGSLCAQLSGDTACVQGAAGSRIGLVLNALSTIVLALGISLYFEWRLSLIALCFAPLSIIALCLEQRILSQENQGDYESLNRSSKIASEAISNIRTVASLGSEDIFYESYVLQLIPYYKTAKRNAYVRGLVHAISRNFLFFSYCATFYYGAILVRDINLDVSLIIIVIECLLAGSWSVANATAFTPNFKKALMSAERIYQLLNRVPKIQNSSEGYIKPWVTGDIKYDKVHFSYPTRSSIDILRGLNLVVPQDKMIALVGPSGCGKSTIVQLLERFYDPKHGKVAVDDRDIKTMNLRNLRSHLGIVSQEPNLFNRSIAENIAYGDNERKIDMGEIIDAAKQANIHNFITALPLGYETPLGEKGTQLSGGQKQRVAIARALIRNPKILLLDEATSALDAESEKVVQAALDGAKRGRTCISIAHRLSTIQDADVIYTINHGKIVESGTHSELIKKKGLYYNLYSLQGGLG